MLSPLTYTESNNCQLSLCEHEHMKFMLSEKTMASVIGLPFRWSRLKIGNFRHFPRFYSTNQQINRKLNSGQKYWWYLLSGSIVAGSYLKWQKSTSVAAFNPKKIKVSAIIG